MFLTVFGNSTDFKFLHYLNIFLISSSLELSRLRSNFDDVKGEFARTDTCLHHNISPFINLHYSDLGILIYAHIDFIIRISSQSYFFLHHVSSP